MNNYKNRYMLALALLISTLWACKKQWSDRTAVTDQQLDKNLMQKIQENKSLSTFAGYLTKLGYDKVLAASKTYTVWAPDDQALQSVDPAVVADTAKLRVFVNNHIANLAYFTGDAKPTLRIRTLNGKKVNFSATTVEEANITAPDQYVSNGVLHVINKALTPKMNISEYVRNLSNVGLLHKGYLLRQDTSYVDTSKATVASVDPVSGKPVLVPGTGLVNQNKYFRNVADLASEDSLYTYFVLTDAAYNAERNKVSRFFATSSTDTTMNILAAYNVLKDVAVKGSIKQADLTASPLFSVKGVAVPVNTSAIVQSYAASNGMVYVVNSMDFALSSKITPIVIEGEKPSFFQRSDRRDNYQYRTKKDPSGNIYQDLMVSGANLPASYFAAYKISNLYTCQYRVSWRCINDFGYATPTNISQRLGFSQITPQAGTTTYTALVQFPYTALTPLNYNEVTLTGAPVSVVPGATINSTGGTLNVTKYNSINMFLQGSTGTALNTNIFTADYIKLTPIL